jgi:hypothetical protein
MIALTALDCWCNRMATATSGIGKTTNGTERASNHGLMARSSWGISSTILRPARENTPGPTVADLWAISKKTASKDTGKSTLSMDVFTRDPGKTTK